MQHGPSSRTRKQTRYYSPSIKRGNSHLLVVGVMQLMAQQMSIPVAINPFDDNENEARIGLCIAE
jgi:hypothetical protein